jgi:hypothetical protein
MIAAAVSTIRSAASMAIAAVRALSTDTSSSSSIARRLLAPTGGAGSGGQVRDIDESAVAGGMDFDSRATPASEGGLV